MFVLVRQRKSKVSRCSLRVLHVVRLHEVTVDRGVNGELSQETTAMTTGASLISLQSYQPPCPRNKCHLSPHDWDRKLRRARCHKHRFKIFTKTRSLFWGLMLCFCLRFLFFSTFIPSSTHTFAHRHTCTLKKLLPCLKDCTLALLLIVLRTRVDGMTFPSFRKIGIF